MPGQHFSPPGVPPLFGGSAYRQSARRLMQAVFQVGTTGSPAQWAAAVAVLDATRKQLYAILAQD